MRKAKMSLNEINALPKVNKDVIHLTKIDKNEIYSDKSNMIIDLAPENFKFGKLYDTGEVIVVKKGKKIYLLKQTVRYIYNYKDPYLITANIGYSDFNGNAKPVIRKSIDNCIFDITIRGSRITSEEDTVAYSIPSEVIHTIECNLKKALTDKSKVEGSIRLDTYTNNVGIKGGEIVLEDHVFMHSAYALENDLLGFGRLPQTGFDDQDQSQYFSEETKDKLKDMEKMLDDEDKVAELYSAMLSSGEVLYGKDKR